MNYYYSALKDMQNNNKHATQDAICQAMKNTVHDAML